jgi:hypothetical protein
MSETKTIFKIAGTDEDKRLVFGFASVSVDASGELLTDLQGDQIEPAELEKAMYDYVAESGEGDVNHNKQHASTLVESFVVTPEKLSMMLKAMGHEAAVDFKGVAAWVGYRVDSDAVWQRVKSGELRAFSIEAYAQRVPA